MIELPEARVIAKDLRNTILGKKVIDVRGNFYDHKFTWYHEDPEKYKSQLKNKTVTDIIDRNFYVEIEIEDYKLVMRDGANIRFLEQGNAFPEKSKLLIKFNDGSFINVSTSMYCLIGVFKIEDNMKDNIYYQLELNGIGALDKEFTYNYFKSLITEKTKKMSTKAFIATEQRILGVGNGVVQDILFNAKLHPKRKMVTLEEKEIQELYESIVSTIKKMIDGNGRDTEKDIYGEKGKYNTILSKNTYKDPCPKCHNKIVKEQYLGGSVYYCPTCQK